MKYFEFHYDYNLYLPEHSINVETSLLRNKICTLRFILDNKLSCYTLSVIRESIFQMIVLWLSFENRQVIYNITNFKTDNRRYHILLMKQFISD